MNAADRAPRSPAVAFVAVASKLSLATYLPGCLLAVAVALVATLAARWAPLAGAPVIAIVLGVALRAAMPTGAVFEPGLRFSAKYVLQAAIAVSGLAVSLQVVARTGAATLPVTLATMATALGLAFILGRGLRLSRTLATLVGVGTAICGASAIAAVSAVLAPAEGDLAVALGTIFAYNVAAVLTFPAIGHAMHLAQGAFGVWAGTAINDTSSVVAAGYAYGRQAGAEATIVKLARATLILPVVAAVAAVEARRARAAGATVPWRRIAPWFILWFLAAACLKTLGVVPAAARDGVVAASTFLIGVALAAIGLRTRLETLLSAGPRPLLFGGLLWVAVATTSLAVQRLTGP